MRWWKLGAGLLALVVMACGGTTAVEESRAQGQLSLPLVTAGADGKTYRLVGATFEITGPQTVTLTDTSATAETVQTALTVGDYAVKLGGSWHLEAKDAPGTAVPAQLLSPNPLPFSVDKDQISEVRFLFKLRGSGTAEVGIQVDGGGWLAGSFHFTALDPAAPTSAFTDLVGKDVPFVISFATSTVQKDGPQSVYVQTGPTVVQFGGPYSPTLARVAKGLAGSKLYFGLRAQGGTISFIGTDLFNMGYRIQLSPTPFAPGAVDADGRPDLTSFTFKTEGGLRDMSGGDGVKGTVDMNGSN